VNATAEARKGADMISVIHGEADKYRNVLSDLPWIIEALRFGHWLADLTARQDARQRVFAFVSSPTLSCLPGFILLGAVVHNGLGVSDQQPEHRRRVLHFLRIWRAGEGAELKRNRDRYRVIQLRLGDDAGTLGLHLPPDLFEKKPELIHEIARYRIVVKKRYGNGPQYPLSTEHCLHYALGNEKTTHEQTLEDLSGVAGIQPSGESHRRLPLFLAGPTRSHLARLYSDDVHLVRPLRDWPDADAQQPRPIRDL
jgi:hypothetical protein